MITTELVRSLRRVLAVDTAAVDRLRCVVTAAAHRAPTARPAQGRGRFALGAVAGVAALAIGVAIALAPPHWLRPDPSPIRRITIERVDRATGDHEEPPGLSGLLARSDVVVAGRVLAVTDDRVEFAIDRVLRGDGTLAHLTVDASDLRALCGRDQPWPVGAAGVLFLVRAATSGRLELVENEQSFVVAGPRGYWDLFTLDDLAAVVASNSFGAERIVALLRERGPRVLWPLRWHCQELPGFTMSTSAPAFQAALAAWWNGTEQPADDLDALLPAAHCLEADGLHALSPAALDRYRSGWPVAARARGARFVADVYLGGAAAARLPWGRDRILEVLAEVERESATTGHLSLAVTEHVELLATLARFGPADMADAARRARDLVPLVPARDHDARGLLQLRRLDWGDPAATAEVVDEFTARFAAGERSVPLGPLLACPVPAALPTLLRALADDRFGALFVRYDGPLRDVLARRPPAPLLRAAAAAIQERVADAGLPFGAFLVHFRLHLAAGNGADRAAALPHFLTIGFVADTTGRDLVRDVEHSLGVRELEFADPTDAEVRAAAARLAGRLSQH